MTRLLRTLGILIALVGGLTSSFHAQQFSPQLISYAAACDQQDPGAARDALEDAVRRSPTPENLYALASAYCAEGTISGRKQAIPLLKRASQAEPGFIAARLLLARLFEGYARRSALAEYRDILQSDPACATAWYRLARLKEEDFYEWRHAANRVFTPRTYLNEQSDMQTAPDTPEHVMHFLPQSDRTRAQERTWIPLMNHSHEDFSEAVHAYGKTIEHDPAQQDAYRRLALLHMETGNH
ncbi:MAG: hypothetical protein RRA94_06685, partial [Bacteroidota bacterium]|nr:hypothetical protein [Bacteroidota bacterium]